VTQLFESNDAMNLMEKSIKDIEDQIKPNYIKPTRFKTQIKETGLHTMYSCRFNEKRKTKNENENENGPLSALSFL